MRYKITVTYGERSRPLVSSPAGGRQEHDGLEEDKAKAAAETFLQDLWRFHGHGVQKVVIEALPG